jgi:predicted DNA-binding transcriptional regulator YafY
VWEVTIIEKLDNEKYNRILSLYTKLITGEVINKGVEAERYRVTERSIQRDIDDLRYYFENQISERSIVKTIIYDRVAKGYKLNANMNPNLSNSEILAVSKILLESRAFIKDELMPIIDKLLKCCASKKDLKKVSDLISNEKFYYIEPHHHTKLVDKLWEIGTAIQEQKVMKIEYAKIKDKAIVKRRIEPVGIMFSEYYFYLMAFIKNIDKENRFENKDDIFPTIYRIDRIKSFNILDEHFYVPYKNRFEEGEFRKRVQFMYGGKLQTIKFKYSGQSLEAVLDRLPTAKVIDEVDGVYTISAEVFGKGIEMWLKNQGNNLEVL